jgi:hypothetical protein
MYVLGKENLPRHTWGNSAFGVNPPALRDSTHWSIGEVQFQGGRNQARFSQAELEAFHVRCRFHERH